MNQHKRHRHNQAKKMRRSSGPGKHRLAVGLLVCSMACTAVSSDFASMRAFASEGDSQAMATEAIPANAPQMNTPPADTTSENTTPAESNLSDWEKAAEAEYTPTKKWRTMAMITSVILPMTNRM